MKGIVDEQNFTQRPSSIGSNDGIGYFVAVMLGADLDGANCTGGNFTGANLTSSRLTNANLTGANLNGANLLNANLKGANVNGVKSDEKTTGPDGKKGAQGNPGSYTV